MRPLAFLPILALAACGSSARPVSKDAIAPATTNPCFTNAPPLEAVAIHQQLDKHTWWWSQSEAEIPPPEAFGSCTVHRGKITAADGTIVAELSCGVDIMVRGIRDDLGLQLGAHGREMLSRWKQPHGDLMCLANGPDQTRCRYERAEDQDTDFSSYVVAGAMPAGTDSLTGPDAERFFAEREIVQILYSAWCH